ncbi:hypothetical protein CEE34_05075 [Candidatus Aerophobetes bacterium Ae_b3a]|nr:MAG: hypothetical protein CEE34_05075 [Candidatus Aerophobetes bacterium Ae_b3a]
MRAIEAEQKSGIFLVGAAAGYTPSSVMFNLGRWGPDIETRPAFIIDVSTGGLGLSTPHQQEVPSVDINREVGEVPIVILEYEDGFTVYPLEIDGVVSQGDTLPQAIHNVKDAISLHIESFGKKKLIPRDERAVRVFVSKTRV